MRSEERMVQEKPTPQSCESAGQDGEKDERGVAIGGRDW